MTQIEQLINLQKFQMGVPFVDFDSNPREDPKTTYYKFHNGCVYRGFVEYGDAGDGAFWVGGSPIKDYITSLIAEGDLIPADTVNISVPLMFKLEEPVKCLDRRSILMQTLLMGLPIYKKEDGKFVFYKVYKNKVYKTSFTESGWKSWSFWKTFTFALVEFLEKPEFKPVSLVEELDLFVKIPGYESGVKWTPSETECEGNHFSDEELEAMQKKYFRKGWERAENRYKSEKQESRQSDPYAGLSGRAWLAKVLMIDAGETDVQVWKRAKKQYMMAHHPDRNKWADQEMVAKVNATFDKVIGKC